MKDRRLGFGDNECPAAQMYPAQIEWTENEDGTGTYYQAPLWGIWHKDFVCFKDLMIFAIPLYRDYKRRGLI